MGAVALLQAGSAWLLNLGFVWLLGTWFARHWLHASGLAQTDYEQVLRRADLLAAVLSVASGATAMWAATAVMGGVSLAEAISMLWMMMSSTAQGQTGCISLLAMLVLFVLRWFGLSGRIADLATLATLLVFTVARASMGHAGEQGLWSAILFAEAVHLFSIGVWSGAVVVSGWVVLRASSQAVSGPATDSYLEAMSQAALCAVVAIFATGLFSAWHRIGNAEHLLHTGYGVTLLVKVALVLLAVGLGGYNKLIGLPAAARSSRGVVLVRTVLQVESLLLLVALLAAALLTSQQPPAAA